MKKCKRCSKSNAFKDELCIVCYNNNVPEFPKTKKKTDIPFTFFHYKRKFYKPAPPPTPYYDEDGNIHITEFFGTEVDGEPLNLPCFRVRCDNCGWESKERAFGLGDSENQIKLGGSEVADEHLGNSKECGKKHDEWKRKRNKKFHY